MTARPPLTREAVLAMPAGPEMDIAVAESVFRLHRLEIPKFSLPYGDIGSPVATPNAFPRRDSYALVDEDGEQLFFVGHPNDMYHHNGRLVPLVPSYSIEIDDAWDVIERLRDEFTNVALHAGNGWGLSLGRIQLNDDGELTETWLPPVNAETAPLAICRAALIARLA